MARKLKVRYIQTEPAAYTSDSDWLMMTAEERGIYHSLIVYLGCNNGQVNFDVEMLCKICNTNREVFARFWKKNGTKFLKKNGRISHKRVSMEIQKARKRLRQQQLAGIASAKSRSTSVNERSNAASTKGREGKGREDNTNNIRNTGNVSVYGNGAFSLPKNLEISSVRFAGQLDKIIKPQSKSDKTALLNFIRWLARMIHVKKYDEGIFADVLEYAQRSKSARKPIAMFFSIVKEELNYESKRIM